jgi:hypothetical protein
MLIWRYLDFTKFVDLLDTRGLFFTRADRFEDRFEGSSPPFNVAERARLYREIPEEALRRRTSFSKQFRTCVAINCWHANPHESAAMWRLYLKSDEGIAIQSTYSQLIASVSESKEDVYCGLVNYIDYDSEWMPEDNLFYPFLHKRKSFAHENELRAIISRFPSAGSDLSDSFEETISDGIIVPVDLGRLITRVFVAPDSPLWLTRLVGAVARQYGITAPVVTSSLAKEPVY